MQTRKRVLLVEWAIRLLVTAGVLFWIFAVAGFAASGWPMLRQMLGCMVTTMAVFAALTFAVGRLRAYRDALAGEKD